MEGNELVGQVVVGSRLHRTATETSDWDYRGIYMEPLSTVVSPFKAHKTTSWIEGDQDNTSYELREFCRLATKGNATIIEVLTSDKIVKTTPLHQEMCANWRKFMDTHNFIQASRGYAHNQYKKALSYDDLGERQQIRTAKFIIAFLRVMWQCEQYLLYDEFKCSVVDCPYYGFINQVKGTPREELDIPLCFAKMEEMDKKLLKAEQDCKEKRPGLYYRAADIEWIEKLLYKAYVGRVWDAGYKWGQFRERHND